MLLSFLFMEEPQFQHRPVNFLRTPAAMPEREPKKRKPFLLYFFIIALLVLVASCGIRQYSLGDLPSDPQAYDPLTLKPKKIGLMQTVKNFVFHGDNFLTGQADDRVNILLLGMGGVGHDGPFLTDTNIILSVKPSTKEVAMVSVPRDLGAKIPDHGLRKINYANAYGEALSQGAGGDFARQIFAETFNIDIPYYIRVDFKAFTELINEVGGVTVDVKNSFTDTMYPGPNDTYQTITFSAGRQNMNGDTALKFARSRHGNNGEASDFARSKRQQQVLTALKEKLLSFGTYTNPAKVQNILSSLSNHVSTNLSFGQMMYLASLARETTGDMKTLVLDNSPSGFLTSGFSADGAFILSPRTGNFKTINAAIADIFEPTVGVNLASAPAENKPVFPVAKIEIQNGTWRAGLAARLQKQLEDRGFTVASIGNCTKRPIVKTGIYLLHDNVSKEITDALAKELGITPIKSLPIWLAENYQDPNSTTSTIGPKYEKDTDVLIILGENAAE